MPQRTKNKAAKPARAAKKAEKKDGGSAKARVKAASKAERRVQKLERRKKEKRMITADMWATPAPSHLVARLDMPQVKSKYQSYFEFADNTEKKQKKLEFQITDDPVPPPGFVFVPIGDPALTNACKELSRDRDAMIFIVSAHKEDHNKISEHMYRTGYHFREVIVEEAREIVGETIISKPAVAPGFIEPIPDSQEEINTQADAAIRDLFPRIPNIDRTMIIEHAFQKGALFHGEPTVGLQSNIPLSRRVQLAVLAHIRHNHTRYDKLLKETSWMNARKAVEPVCLDILVKWRGDEETGRDQMDEILREVVIITDSEGDDDSSDEDSSDDDEDEVTSASSTEEPSPPPSSTQQRPRQLLRQPQTGAMFSRGMMGTAVPKSLMPAHTRGVEKSQSQQDKRSQRGFKRYQAAWDDALTRNHVPSTNSGVSSSMQLANTISKPSSRAGLGVPISNASPLMLGERARLQPASPDYNRNLLRPQQSNRADGVHSPHSQPRPTPANLLRRNEVIVRPLSQRPAYHEGTVPTYGTNSHPSQDIGPPQVVRVTPTGHGLQDMLLRSIETTSSDVRSQRVDDERRTNSTWVRSPISRPLIENRRLSPLPKQVVVIEDDSPQGKRRRVVREENSGYTRLIPTRDQNLHSQPRPDSPSMLQPYPQPVEMHHRPAEPSESRQGLFQSSRKEFLSHAEAERLGGYDVPQEGYSATHPRQLGRSDVGYASFTTRGEFSTRPVGSVNPPLESSRNIHYPPRPVIDQRRETLRRAELDNAFRPVLEHNHADHLGVSSPNIAAQSRISRPYDASYRSAAADQDFVDTFSQSRLDGASLRPDQGFTILSERSHHPSTTQGSYRQEYENHPARSFATAPLSRARSPAQYMDRPVHYNEAFHRSHDQQRPSQRYVPSDQPGPAFRDLNVPHPAAEPPTFVRTVGPKRQIIVIE